MTYIQPAARGVPFAGARRDQCHHGIAPAPANAARPHTPARPRDAWDGFGIHGRAVQLIALRLLVAPGVRCAENKVW